MIEIFGFVTVLCVALIFTFLTIYRQSKISAIYSSLAFVFWFVLTLIHPAVFYAEPVFLPIAWLWFAIGVILEVIGIYISLDLMKADRERRDLQL